MRLPLDVAQDSSLAQVERGGACRNLRAVLLLSLLGNVAIAAEEAQAGEGLVAADPTDRHLVLRRRGQYDLLDTQTRREVILDAREQLVSFDALGSQLIYTRTDKKLKRDIGVVRALASGAETIVNHGAGSF